MPERLKEYIKSLDGATRFRNSLSWGALISGIVAIAGSYYSPSLPNQSVLTVIVFIASAWAVVCQQAEGMITGKVFNVRIPGVVFFIIAFLTPLTIPIVLGAFLGGSFYLMLLAMIIVNTKVELTSGDRFYMFSHPLMKLFPMGYLAPEPLSTVFSPIVSFHWSVGSFNIRTWKLVIFDPPSIHQYIRTRAGSLVMGTEAWVDKLATFRRAMGILHLLNSLRKFEETDLDGVALAASARLALADIPISSRVFLSEVLSTMEPNNRGLISRAFDIVSSER